MVGPQTGGGARWLYDAMMNGSGHGTREGTGLAEGYQGLTSHRSLACAVHPSQWVSSFVHACVSVGVCASVVRSGGWYWRERARI